MAVTLQYRVRMKYNKLEPILRNLDRHVDGAINKYAKDDLIPSAQRHQAPHIETGALNASGEVVGQGMLRLLVKFTGGAPGRVDGLPRIYASYHEYGTRFTGAYPFLGPAVDATWPGDILDRVIEIFR